MKLLLVVNNHSSANLPFQNLVSVHVLAVYMAIKTKFAKSFPKSKLCVRLHGGTCLTSVLIVPLILPIRTLPYTGYILMEVIGTKHTTTSKMMIG